MLRKLDYNRTSAIEYAKKWAFLRNPKYIDFENLGGDCTNFVSQCLYSGCHVMNYTKTFGWYYKNSYDRAPSWSNTVYLYNFLIKNNRIGPYGIETNIKNLEPGDIIQLGTNEKKFYHSMIVVKISNDQIFVAAHTVDSYMRPLSSYDFENIRFIHIVAVNKP